jgi:hypothetical protein
VVSLRLVTPGLGPVTLSGDPSQCAETELFHLAKLGLGGLGVVSQVYCVVLHCATLRCVWEGGRGGSTSCC